MGFTRGAGGRSTFTGGSPRGSTAPRCPATTPRSMRSKIWDVVNFVLALPYEPELLTEATHAAAGSDGRRGVRPALRLAGPAAGPTMDDDLITTAAANLGVIPRKFSNCRHLESGAFPCGTGAFSSPWPPSSAWRLWCTHRFRRTGGCRWRPNPASIRTSFPRSAGKSTACSSSSW